MRVPRAALPLALLSSPLAAALDSNPPESPQLLSDTTDVCSAAQGRTSTCEVELDVPASCIDNGGSDCPVVFFFHGAGGSNNGFARNTQVHSRNVIGVYPQGENGWNTGPKSSNVCSWDDFACSSDPDEGAFVAGIISELRGMGATGHIYLVGNSNGAALAHRLAANAGAADLPIKGIVTKVTQLLASPPRSGPGVLNHNQPASGGPAVSVLNLMGMKDGLIPYEGGSSGVFGGDENFQLMGALESMEAWAAHDGCSAQDPTVTSGVSYTTDNDPGGTTATFYEYQGCPAGIIVEHYAVHEAGHSFGAGGALDGVSIDYELAYGFIARVEAGGGGGTPSPGPPSSASPTAAPVQGVACEDDPDWHGKFNADHTCAYVADAPAQRCGWESSDGTKASEACRAACDACPTASPVTAGPTGSPVSSTSSPTISPVQSVACQDDLNWHGRVSADHNCDHVALNPGIRCNWESTDGTKASEACRVTCGACDSTPSPSSSPTPSCITCSNVPAPWMITQNYECATAPNWLIRNNCINASFWVNNNYCETRCQEAGYGYHATGSCCSSSS